MKASASWWRILKLLYLFFELVFFQHWTDVFFCSWTSFSVDEGKNDIIKQNHAFLTSFSAFLGGTESNKTCAEHFSKASKCHKPKQQCKAMKIPSYTCEPPWDTKPAAIKTTNLHLFLLDTHWSSFVFVYYELMYWTV